MSYRAIPDPGTFDKGNLDPANMIFWEVEAKGQLVARMQIVKESHNAAVHFQSLGPWGPEIVKSLKVDWQAMIAELKGQGIRMLIAANSNLEDERWPKFIKLFGFPKPIEVFVSQQEI